MNLCKLEGKQNTDKYLETMRNHMILDLAQKFNGEKNCFVAVAYIQSRPQSDRECLELHVSTDLRRS